MDNDNKVKSEVQIFLQTNEKFYGTERPKMYNLEDEYAKTKKNKSSYVTVLMLICIIVVAGISYGVTKLIEHNNEQITVGIDVFEDLNLKKLLDMVTRTEDSLAQARKEKSTYEIEMQNALNLIDDKLKSDKAYVQKLRLGATKTKERNAKLESDARKQRREIHAQYDSKIAQSTMLVQDLESQLEKLDGNNVQRAQEQQAAIDSQRQLFELEKEKLISEYENTISTLREKLVTEQKTSLSNQQKAIDDAINEYKEKIDSLDPTVKDKKILSLIQKNTEETEKSKETLFGGLSNQEEILNQNEITDNAELQTTNTELQTTVEQKPLSFKEALAQTEKDTENANTLAQYITTIPFENSMLSITNTLNDISKRIKTTLTLSAQNEFDNYNQTINELKNQNKETESKIELLNSMYDYFSKQIQDSEYDGFLIEKASKNSYLGFVKADKLPVKQGQKAQIVLQDNSENIEANLFPVGKFVQVIPTDKEKFDLLKNSDKIIVVKDEVLPQENVLPTEEVLPQEQTQQTEQNTELNDNALQSVDIQKTEETKEDSLSNSSELSE